MMSTYHVIGPSIKDKKRDSFENRKRERREKEVVVQQEEEGQGEALDAPGEEGLEEEGEDPSEEEVLIPLRTPPTHANGEIVMRTEKQSDKGEMDLAVVMVTSNPVVILLRKIPHMTRNLLQRQWRQR